MKTPTIIALAALIIAIAALLRSDNYTSRASEEKALDRLVNEAVARKERAYVDALSPKMNKIYQDMLGEKYQIPENPPTTFEELFKPAVQIIGGLSTED